MFNYSDIESKLGYYFKNKDLLSTAITHKSYAYEKNQNEPTSYNERLEFLGDAVLEHIISIHLYNLTPALKEGVMSKKRAEMVCEASLSKAINENKLARFVKLGKCEIATGGNKKDAILADMFEAILGAVYLDGGFEEAKKVCLKLLDKEINSTMNETESADFKTRLQEILQKNGNVKINYILDKEEGKDHAKLFYSSVYFEGKKIGEGSGKTKKASEQAAAKMAVECMQSKNKTK